MEPGTKLGHFTVLAAIGKGGMGEVWRALDTKLGREIAIKTLPDEFSRDADRLARFEREAKLLASLNHSNIAAIYGLEEQEGTRFLVLELVEGETLDERLQRGAIPVEESLKLAHQIAEALEAAHEKGVIHRDLKPANIKVSPDGRVKVLDFGLAKALIGNESQVSLSNSPTLSMQATAQGVILGTAAYMSPEQARGHQVDKRTDIWSFGCVLLEMLTGRSAFGGTTVSDVLAGVLRAEPEWNSLPPDLHPRVRFLLERCLEKDVHDRCHDISDVRAELQRARHDSSSVSGQQSLPHRVAAKKQVRLTWMGAAATLGVIIAGVGVWILKPEAARAVIRFSDVLPLDQSLKSAGRRAVTVSPDGSSIVYVAKGRLWFRSLENAMARPIPGTEEDPEYPTFSPDSAWVAYWAKGQLKKIPVTGGSAVVLTEAINPTGFDWYGDYLLFGQNNTQVLQVSANGGKPKVVMEPSGGEQFGSPHMLPGGHAMLGVRALPGSNSFDVAAYSFENGEVKTLIPEGNSPRYIDAGYLVYALNGTLLAAPFDPSSLEVLGESIPVVQDLGQVRGTYSWNYEISDNGVLVYVPGAAYALTGRQLVLVARDGTTVPISEELRAYDHPRFSPDGNSIAVEVTSRVGNEAATHIWIVDARTGIGRQLTFEGSLNQLPTFTPEGEAVVFTSNRNGTDSLFRKAADGGGEAKLLLETGKSLFSNDTSREGVLVLEENSGQGITRDIWTLELDGASPTKFLATPDDERTGHFSPDGHWLAYVSNVSGQDEIYVRPYPRTEGNQRRISAGRSAWPVWSPNGNEIYYVVLGGPMMAVSVRQTKNGFEYGRPEKMFDFVGPFRATSQFARGYDVHPNGNRFVAVSNSSTDTDTSVERINVVLNWTRDLRAAN